MSPALFAANYELRHLPAEDALFPARPDRAADAAPLADGIAHLDASYGGGDGTALTLANCREGGVRFISVEELGRACPKVSQTHLETLKRIGALGELPETSQINLFDL